MFKLIAQNPDGAQLDFSATRNYQISNIDGMGPPDAIIATSKNAMTDGGIYDSAKLDTRTIVITLAINQPAEVNRINLYKWFRSRYPVRLYYSNDARNVYIDGYTQNVNISMFAKKQVAQVTILCPGSALLDSEERNIYICTESTWGQYPAYSGTINNPGDMECGATFLLQTTADCNDIAIHNRTRVERIRFERLSMTATKVLALNTRRGELSARLYATMYDYTDRPYLYTDVLPLANYPNASWPQLDPGDNDISISCNRMTQVVIQTHVIFRPQFEGV
jgi:hypothetical protein